MKQSPLPKVELRDVAPGLWIWRHEHPHWKPGQGWEPIVASTCVELRGETLLLDPLAPSEAAAEFWKRLDARPPTAVVVLKPDHVRDVDLFLCGLGESGRVLRLQSGAEHVGGSLCGAPRAVRDSGI